jgi:hypothetical protein
MPDDFTIHTKAMRTQSLTEEFNDLQNEIAGRDVGKNSRFLPSHDEPVSGKSKSERKTGITAFDLLMQDIAYQKTYQRTYHALADTEALLHHTLLQSQVRLDEAHKALQGAKYTDINPDQMKRLNRVVTDAKNQHDRLLGYDSELQVIRDHMQDHDNPPSQAELDSYQKQIGDLHNEIRQHNSEYQQTAPETEISSAIAKRSSEVKPLIL